MTFTFGPWSVMFVIRLEPCARRWSLAAKLSAVLPHLDERQRRLVMGAETRALGHGGIKTVARAAGLSAVTVSNGVAELDAADEPLGRTRRPGGGRKPVAETDPGGIEISVIAYSRSMNGKRP